MKKYNPLLKPDRVEPKVEIPQITPRTYRRPYPYHMQDIDNTKNKDSTIYEHTPLRHFAMPATPKYDLYQSQTEIKLKLKISQIIIKNHISIGYNAWP